jgi:hypothetical protein
VRDEVRSALQKRREICGVAFEVLAGTRRRPARWIAAPIREQQRPTLA